MDYFQAYLRGQETEVWDRLCDLEQVRDADVVENARQVAMEAMRRARRNIERLIPRWESRGYKFGYQWASSYYAEEVKNLPPLLGEPIAADLSDLDRFEREKGPLPIVLRAFYEVIGAVNFVGEVADGWPEREILDPLQVEAFSPQLPRLLCEETDETDDADEVVLFADFLLKYFVAGVGAITVRVPSPSFDPALRFERGDLEEGGKRLTFGRYLRDVILNRGGIGSTGEYDYDTPDRALIAFLTDGLEPF